MTDELAAMEVAESEAADGAREPVAGSEERAVQPKSLEDEIGHGRAAWGVAGVEAIRHSGHIDNILSIWYVAVHCIREIVHANKGSTSC